MRTRMRPRVRIQQQLARREHFDIVHGTFPNRIYILSDTNNDLAITGESESEFIMMQPPDPNNKYQWVMVDSDTGAINFFVDLTNRLSITIAPDGSPVKRSDVLKNGNLVFNSDRTITLRDYPNYCLAYKKFIVDPFSNLFMSKEYFSASDTLLLVMPINLVTSEYINTWKFTQVHDLRDLTDNLDLINELWTASTSGDIQVTSLQQLIETNKLQHQTELEYKNKKLQDANEKINEYESNWFVRWFLKK